MNLIKHLSYNAFIIKVIRFLRLRTISRKIYYFFVGPKNGILEVRLNNINTKFYVGNPDELRLAESVSGQWGERPVIEALILNINPEDCIFDVGANIGIYTAIMARLAKKVIAFEPEEDSFTHLKNNMSLNKLENVILFKEALGQTNEEGKLFIGKTTGNFSLIKPYEKEINYQKVSIVNGDDFVKKNNLPIPKAVKIDVEGYEYSVLYGLKNTLSNEICKVLCCEIHPGLFPEGITEEKILLFIKSLGFSKIEYFKRPFSAYHVIAKK